MSRFFASYLRVSLVIRIGVAFIAGSLAGGLLWYISATTQTPVAHKVIPWIAPFGTVFVQMLKMIVVPVIFLSLIAGASSLPIRQFGRVGARVLIWYMATSVAAAVLGMGIALLVSPGRGTELSAWRDMAEALGGQAEELSRQASQQNGLSQILLGMFMNPVEALANNQFLAIIVFSILFGLGLRACHESSTDPQVQTAFETLDRIIGAARDVLFRLVDWVLEYSPIGVFALAIMNFGLHGPEIVGPYIKVVLAVVSGIAIMVFGVYSVLIWLFAGTNPYQFLRRIQKPMLMAFVTRSSAATLPVSIETMCSEVKVRRELAGFSLPLGATVNMDGVCVHLPMFAVLAANLFGVSLGMGDLAVLVAVTVLASIGAGGVPGGSLMLLFMLLGTMGLSSSQTAVIVALALGINPVLDMFETMNNVTGDLVCTYVVAKREGLIEEDK